ncbi:hypothetical protein HCN44_005498 [Aphidius gifuensis]|uniref:Uncharacterized protein n=1 Tax=Aphidius gifuensis TaxID=684658 RepID=A0A834Y389_APHGI|nr:hypothetical protein HCN44_005498 [Aphidius gifuensis]
MTTWAQLLRVIAAFLGLDVFIIFRLIYQRDSVKGFYQGHVGAYVPDDVLWWGLNTFYQASWVSHLFIQALAGIFADFKTNDITSPLDIVQARLQVQRLDSMCQVFEILKKI